MKRHLVAIVAGLLCVCGLTETGNADASARRGTPAPKVPSIRLTFHRVVGLGVADNPITDGRYVLIPSATNDSQATLIDAGTGRSQQIVAPTDCWIGSEAAIGGGNVAVDCDESGAPAFAVYSISSGGWRQYTDNSGVDENCETAQVTCSVAGVGSRWLEIALNCDHCDATFADLSLMPGQEAPGYTLNSTTVLDLSSPTQTAQLCSPVQVLNDGDVTPYGSFAVVSRRSGTYVQQCGSRRQQLIDRGIYWHWVASPQFVVWVDDRSLSTLDIERVARQTYRYTVTLPSRFTAFSPQFVLAGRSLFVVASSGGIYETKLPLRIT